MLGALLVVSPASAATRCTEPEPAVTYEAGSINLSLDVDLTGCTWWRKDTIDLEAAMSQGPLLGFGAGASSSCMAFSGRGKRAIARTCDINLTIDHSETEAATYTGYFEYPWKSGPKRIEFSMVCAAAAGTAECIEN